MIVESVPGKIMAEKAPPRKRLAMSALMSVVDDAQTSDPIRPTNPISMQSLAPEAVAEGTGGQQQCRQRDCVGVDDPGEVRLRCLQLLADRRDRDVQAGDATDDHHHRQTHRRDDQRRAHW